MTTKTTDHKAQLRAHRDAHERDLILAALQHHGGNITQTARSLQLSRRGLQLRLRDLGLRAEVDQLKIGQCCARCGAAMNRGVA